MYLLIFIIRHGVDAIDNGVSQYPADLKPKYLEMTSLSSRVSRLNSRWNEEVSDDLIYDQFLKASL